MSSAALIYFISEMLFNSDIMKTIEETRLTRLTMLKDECGSVAALAERTGHSQSQLSQWLNESKDSKTGKPRTIASTSCRSIEIRLGKDKGWMDQPVYDVENKDIEIAIEMLKTLKPYEIKKIPDIINVVRQHEVGYASEPNGKENAGNEKNRTD